MLIDPEVLNTLSDSVFNDGMAEVIKYGFIVDEAFYLELEQYKNRAEVMTHIEAIIEKSCLAKKELVQADEKDQSERMLLNFGHTIGHAIESYYNYEKYTHGQAIAIGMVAINQLTEDLAISEKGSTAKIEHILKQYHLPTQLEDKADYQSILPLIKNDKKNFLLILLALKMLLPQQNPQKTTAQQKSVLLHQVDAHLMRILK